MLAENSMKPPGHATVQAMKVKITLEAMVGTLKPLDGWASVASYLMLFEKRS